MFTIVQAKKDKGVTCCAFGCKGKAIARKAGMCHKHFARHRKIIDPVYDRYRAFKSSALKRRISFTITLEDFRKYCAETGYIIVKGRRGKACSVDRKDNTKGYDIDNIQLLTMRANINKWHYQDKGINEYEKLPF